MARSQRGGPGCVTYRHAVPGDTLIPIVVLRARLDTWDDRLPADLGLRPEDSAASVGRLRKGMVAELRPLIDRLVAEAGPRRLIRAVAMMSAAPDQRLFPARELALSLLAEECLTEDQGASVLEDTSTLGDEDLDAADALVEAIGRLVQAESGHVKAQRACGSDRLRSRIRESQIVDRWYIPLDLVAAMVGALEQDLATSGLGPLWSVAGHDATAAEVDALLAALMQLAIYPNYPEVTIASEAGPVADRVAELRSLLGTRSEPWVSLDDIVRLTALPPARARIYLEELACTLEELAETHADDLRSQPEHLLSRRPLIRWGEDRWLLSGPVHLARSVLGAVLDEKNLTGTRRDSLSNAVERVTRDALDRLPSAITWQGVNWTSETDNGEFDVVALLDRVTITCECKSALRPTTRIPDVSTKPYGQLDRVQQAAKAGIETTEGAAWTAEYVLRRLTGPSIDLVIIGTDLWSVTTALAPHRGDRAAGAGVPLTISLGDLLLITTALEPFDALAYMCERHRIGDHPLLGEADEELLLAIWLERGFGSLSQDMDRRMAPPDVITRFGLLAKNLAWRNCWRAFGAPQPPTRTPASSTAYEQMQRALTAGGHMHEALLLAAFRIDRPFVDELQLAVATVRDQPVPVASSGLALPARMAMMHLMVVVTSELPAAFAELLDRAAGGLQRIVGSVLHPQARAYAAAIVWNPMTNAIATRALGDPALLTDLGPPSDLPFERPQTPPGRNEPCWCGSGRKMKQCEPGHWPTPWWSPIGR